MNPMKLLADQTVDILRLLGTESREEAADLLPRVPAMKVLRKRDDSAAEELASLVLARFRADEPPSVRDRDFLAEAKS